MLSRGIRTRDPSNQAAADLRFQNVYLYNLSSLIWMKMLILDLCNYTVSTAYFM
jgi:hypothetical protein